MKAWKLLMDPQGRHPQEGWRLFNYGLETFPYNGILVQTLTKILDLHAYQTILPCSAALYFGIFDECGFGKR